MVLVVGAASVDRGLTPQLLTSCPPPESRIDRSLETMTNSTTKITGSEATPRPRLGDANQSSGPFSFQLSITESCNFRCAHCYKEDFDPVELSSEQFEFLLEQFRAFLDTIVETAQFASYPGAGRAVVALTGGEPLLHERILEFLAALSHDSDHFRPRLLTNGSLVTQEVACALASFPMEVVSVSLDGTQSTNDQRRGSGAFERTVKGIEHLVASGVPTVISFSADRQNFSELSAVAALAKQLGVKRFWSDRCVPFGRSVRKNVMSQSETLRYVSMMRRCAMELDDEAADFKVLRHRALQFLGGADTDNGPIDDTRVEIYRCDAGLFPMAVAANGDLYPCRRLPIRVGNLFESRLLDVYVDSPVMQRLRGLTVPEDCRSCAHGESCNGGLRCMTYAITEAFDGKDAGCWLCE